MIVGLLEVVVHDSPPARHPPPTKLWRGFGFLIVVGATNCFVRTEFREVRKWAAFTWDLKIPYTCWYMIVGLLGMLVNDCRVIEGVGNVHCYWRCW